MRPPFWKALKGNIFLFGQRKASGFRNHLDAKIIFSSIGNTSNFGYGYLFEATSRITRRSFSARIGLTLFIAAIIIIMAGTSIAVIDPAVETPWNGIWWA